MTFNWGSGAASASADPATPTYSPNVITASDLGTYLDAYSGVGALDIDAQNLQWQKDFANMIFEREDNAMQRKARDYELAGLSKWGLAGKPGAGAGGIAKAPQKGTKGQEQVQQFAFGTAAAVMNILQGLSQVDKTKAETELIRGTTPSKITISEADAELKTETLDAAIRTIKTNASIADHKNTLDSFHSRMTSLQWSIYKDFIKDLGGTISDFDSTGQVQVHFPPGKNPELLKYQALLATKQLTEQQKNLTSAQTLKADMPTIGQTTGSFAKNAIDRVLEMFPGLKDWFYGGQK